MLDTCHYNEAGAVFAIAIGTDDSAQNVWIISSVCTLSDIEIAEHIATAMLANILKASYDSSYDRNTHRTTYHTQCQTAHATVKNGGAEDLQAGTAGQSSRPTCQINYSHLKKGQDYDSNS